MFLPFVNHQALSKGSLKFQSLPEDYGQEYGAVSVSLHGQELATVYRQAKEIYWHANMPDEEKFSIVQHIERLLNDRFDVVLSY